MTDAVRAAQLELALRAEARKVARTHARTHARTPTSPAMQTKPAKQTHCRRSWVNDRSRFVRAKSPGSPSGHTAVSTRRCAALTRRRIGRHAHAPCSPRTRRRARTHAHHPLRCNACHSRAFMRLQRRPASEATIEAAEAKARADALAEELAQLRRQHGHELRQQVTGTQRD